SRIVIPNSVNIIKEATFAECTNLSSIVIPNSVTEIELNAFYDCTKCCCRWQSYGYPDNKG
ncbi:MAG: leucine-rich repeat protein, partial [Lachnospiraceae bacterium]|nr:leucine-rich repeat protein [Lachnospiraceae bacterium]